MATVLFVCSICVALNAFRAYWCYRQTPGSQLEAHTAGRLKMKQQDLENLIVWGDYGIGSVELFLPIFGKKIKFKLFVDDTNNLTISEKMFNTILDVVNLPNNAINELMELLWEECDFAFSVADYGVEQRAGETMKQAHFREFELTDKNDAFEKSRIIAVQVHQKSDALEGRYAELQFETATDNLVSVIVKNGLIIDYDDDGTDLGSFENDDQRARNQRQITLNE